MRRALPLPTAVFAAALLLVLPSLVAIAMADDNSWQTELASWRAQRAAGLQAPDGWLSLIGLDWLQAGDNSFGSDADNRIQMNAKIPGHVGVVRLDKGALRLLPPAEGFPKDLLVDGRPAQEQALTADDAEKP